MQDNALRAIVTIESIDGGQGKHDLDSSRSTREEILELPDPLLRELIVNRLGRVLLSVGSLAVVSAANAEAQLPAELANWLSPLQGCRTINCIIKNIPTTPPPNWPTNIPWNGGNSNGPITTTPEPLTMALLGTGLAGIGLAARRRKEQPLV
jgi:hypothetical protein